MTYEMIYTLNNHAEHCGRTSTQKIETFFIVNYFQNVTYIVAIHHHLILTIYQVMHLSSKSNLSIADQSESLICTNHI